MQDGKHMRTFDKVLMAIKPHYKMIKKFLFKDRIYRLPRIWSNNELKKFSHLFEGDIVNISGWQDSDKEGGFYKDYFIKNKNYYITNIGLDRGLQNGIDNQIELDLSKDLSDTLKMRFDVCFNHTTLEHIFELDKAFQNICEMSNDIVILVTPFSQPSHYAKDKSWLDYWRMTPFAIEKLFNMNNYDVIYMSSNNNLAAGSYIFSIATRNKEKWLNKHHDFGKKSYDCDCGMNVKKPFKFILNLFKF